jgi:hypothetical protein
MLNINLDNGELVATIYSKGEQYNLYCFGKNYIGLLGNKVIFTLNDVNDNESFNYIVDCFIDAVLLN